MSGFGSSNQAPTRLTPIVVDQPITDARTGQPTPYFAQMMQRVLSYLGQPGSSTGTGTTSSSGLTVSEQLTNLNTSVEVLQAAAGGVTPGQAGVTSRIALIEQIIRNLLRFGPPPPQRPNMTPALIMSWWR